MCRVLVGPMLQIPSQVQTLPERCMRNACITLKQNRQTSSNSKMAGFFRMARAIAIRCFWPPEINILQTLKQRAQSSFRAKILFLPLSCVPLSPTRVL
jgi:hypothetical protein